VDGGSHLLVYVGFKLEKAELASAGDEWQSEGITKDEAKLSVEPLAVHVADAIDDPSHADHTAPRHSHLSIVFFVDLGFRNACVHDEPAAAFRGPVAVLDIFAVMENVMGVRLLNAERLDLSSGNTIG
jgi:hypothetical protein